VKYFRKKDGSDRGERSGIPQVVIGVDKNTVFKLASLWIKGDTGLGNHPAQRVILDEIVHQLETVHEFASKRGQRNVADAYGRSLSTIKKILDQKKQIAHGEFAQDRVYRGIFEHTDRIFEKSAESA
jgi:hypothetical protein